MFHRCRRVSHLFLRYVLKVNPATANSGRASEKVDFRATFLDVKKL